MKHFLFLACCLVLALPARAATDPFAEFRIPGHAWRSGTAGLTGSADWTERRGISEFDRSHSVYSNLSGGLLGGWDSDALQYGYGLSLSGLLDTGHSQSGLDAPIYSRRVDEVTRRSNEDWELLASLRSYPWRVPVGLGASADLHGTYSQDRARTDDWVIWNDPEGTRLQNRRLVSGGDRQIYGTANISAGLGRVRDASVVYDVHLLEERLAGAGALTRPLSAGAREKLAALYYVAPSFMEVHERPERFVWREIERVLRKDGALGEGGLDAYSVLRALERTAPGGRPQRRRGWFVGLVSELRTQHQSVNSSREETYRLYQQEELVAEDRYTVPGNSKSSYDWGSLGGQAEYHRPFGWRWQLDATTRATRPVRQGEKGLDALNQASLSWFVADRWLASASAVQTRSYFGPREWHGKLSNDDWKTQAGAGIAYYVEDHTRLSLAILQTQARSEYYYYPTRTFRREVHVTLGVDYRFLGRLEAPGLMGPVTMLP